MTDWRSIREEYITGELPMRALAEKHGVSFNTLKDHAKKEDWSGRRAIFRETKELPPSPQEEYHRTAVRPPLPFATTATTNREELSPAALDPALCVGAEEIFRVSRKLLCQIDVLLPRCGTMYDLRLGTSALKDLRELLLSHPVMDAEEQRARIDRLQAEIREHEKDPKDNRLEVVFRDGAEKYGV